MSDRYLNLVNSPVGSAVASRVGLPRPAVLRRYSAGDPLLPGPALLGSTTGKAAAALKRLLTSAGVEVVDVARRAASKVAARRARRALGRHAGRPRRRCASSWRPGVKALGAVRPGDRARPRRPTAPTSPPTPPARRSTASSARWPRSCAAARPPTCCWVADEASLPSALRFFLSGRSAYVDGQPLLLGPGTAPAPKDWDQPLAGKTALVTGAARGIGAAIAGVLARDGANVIVADLTQAGEALAKVANRVGGTALHLDVAAPEAPQRLLDHLAAHTDGLDILDPQRRHHPRQADGQHEARAVGLGHRGQPRVAAAHQRRAARQRPAQRRSRASSACRRRPGCRATAARRTTARRRPASSASSARRPPRSPRTAPRRSTPSRPGFIDTEMTAKMPLATREVARRLSSLQQAGLPIDVAEAVAWLSSPGAGGVNGQVLRVCGQNLVGA